MADPGAPSPLPEHGATLAHVLAVQGAVRATLEALALAGALDRAAVAGLLGGQDVGQLRQVGTID